MNKQKYAEQYQYIDRLEPHDDRCKQCCHQYKLRYLSPIYLSQQLAWLLCAVVREDPFGKKRVSDSRYDSACQSGIGGNPA